STPEGLVVVLALYALEEPSKPRLAHRGRWPEHRRGRRHGERGELQIDNHRQVQAHRVAKRIVQRVACAGRRVGSVTLWTKTRVTNYRPAVESHVANPLTSPQVNVAGSKHHRW